MAQSIIQFKGNSVKVNGSVFSLTPSAFETVKAWYESNKDEPEEVVVEELEYLAKAYSLLKPITDREAQRFLKVLEDAYVMTDYKLKEVIDGIYNAVRE